MTAGAKTFDLATERHRQGRVEEAERLYQTVLGEDPKHADSMFLLSVIAMSAGKLEPARDLLERAVGIAPENPAYHSNLGEVYRRLGRHEDAVQALLTALSLRPDLAEPAFNLGLALRALGEDEMALGSFERAADFKYDSFPVQYELATALRIRGQLERSIGHFHAALSLNPKALNALVDLGNVLRMLGRFEQAIAVHRRAVDLDPTHVLAHNNLGTTFLESGQTDEAIACFRRALELDPSFAPAHNNLGNAMKDHGRLDEALTHFRRAVEQSPRDHPVHSNFVYTLSFHPDYDAPAILREARRWSAQHVEPSGPAFANHTNDRSPDRRLRIGYVSPDFREHCQSFFTIPLLTHHDRVNFEIVAYSNGHRTDQVTERLHGLTDLWRPIAGLDDAVVAKMMREDQIDVLVDLTMHMAEGRLKVLAEKPAPVQISWLAYPGTTGVAAVDYRVTDRYLDPPDVDAMGWYGERSLYLPETFWCYDPLGGPEVSALPAIAKGHVTFGCLNNFCKVNDRVIELWARVLHAVPGSTLFVMAPQGEPRRRMQQIFERSDVDPKRLEFVGRRPRQEYLAHYQRIDICLDTFPYNGHTTSLDAFWMGVPVVTLVGKTIAGRAGLCQAMNLGLPELVATTPDEYVDRAAALARDLDRLGELRSTLRERMEKSPLMDAPRFARHLEAAYRTAWRDYCERSPLSIDEPT